MFQKIPASLGKALGGGILPLSAVVADRDVLGVIRPGEHGSTFGGNPLACSAALAVLSTIESEGLMEHAVTAGELLVDRVAALEHPLVRDAVDAEHEGRGAVARGAEVLRRGVVTGLLRPGARLPEERLAAVLGIVVFGGGGDDLRVRRGPLARGGAGGGVLAAT